MRKLRILIFDVEHGFCAFVISPNGYGLLIDCGRKEHFSPVKYILENEMSSVRTFNGYKLAQFILTHPHDDHLNDVERLKNYLPPAIMIRQRYDWEEVKNGGSQQGEYENLDAFSQWQKSYNRKVVQWPDWGMELKYMENGTYLTPQEAKELDEAKFVNNSSIVAAVEYKGWKILLPGDLEKAAWLELLGNQSFRNLTGGTSFFVASHHGHSSGYCKEIFENMGKPWFNVVSARKKDGSVDPAYSSSDNAKGINYKGKTRYMLSTRNDGTVVIEVDENGNATVDCVHIDDNLTA